MANQCQYNQAQQTPFGSGYLVESIGLSPSNENALNLLQCGFIPDPNSTPLQETNDIINQLSTPMIMISKDIAAVITPKLFMATFCIVRETTSSSPSGRHLGHYKAVLPEPLLVKLHAGMMSIPYMGFSPSRWRQVVDTVLEKVLEYPSLTAFES